MENKEQREKLIQERLNELEKEKSLLQNELHLIKEQNLETKQLSVESFPLTSKQKVSLFLKLFRCRQDIYPKLWENPKTGAKGYSPACNNEWRSGICEKPNVKCSECLNQSFPYLDDLVAQMHLEGKHTIGSYAIRKDDTCTFLATDFDKSTWKEDVFAFKNAGLELGIEMSVERSRSGNGAHAWIFFNESVSAKLARQLGTLIMSKAAHNRHTLSLESYDRFFPNQDYLPKGGFGNLIALPLQKVSRESGNSIFIDESFCAYENQWAYLSLVKRYSVQEIKSIVDKYILPNKMLIHQSSDEDMQIAEKMIRVSGEELPKLKEVDTIEIEWSNRLKINTKFLPGKLIRAFESNATFANPKFFELQRLRMSTWKTPRFIFCGEYENELLYLPRGVLEDCRRIAEKAGVHIRLIDKRISLERFNLQFLGKLKEEQELAVSVLEKHDLGVLVAPPGVGKTVIACSLVAKRKVSTLILVHRTQLVEQWKSQLCMFLNMEPDKIGVYGGSSKKLKGLIDIAMIQSLSKLKDSDIYSKYEQIIIDECHHIPAVSFELVLNQFPARYVLGLTATPYRKDGHQTIIYMQCGPLRHQIEEKTESDLIKKVFIKETSFQMPSHFGIQPEIHNVWEQLVSDSSRLNLIARDVCNVLKAGRFPLILSERKEHLYLLADAIKKMDIEFNRNEFLLVGEMGKKARKKVLDAIRESLKNSIPTYILSTGALIGEGFDLPELDTLFLAMPVSFKGKVIQYAGRLHRLHPGKKEVNIYDYLDKFSGLTISMLKKRILTYEKMGYTIISENSNKASQMIAKKKRQQDLNNGWLFGQDYREGK